MARSNEKYPGVLGEPFEALDAALDEAGSDRTKLYEVLSRRSREKEAKLEMLLNYFGVPGHWSPEDRWHMLAMRLAEKHVAGLRAKVKVGARKKWTEMRKAELRIAVDDLAALKRKSVTWACDRLAKEDPWKSILAHERPLKKPGEALRTQYKAANADLVAYIHQGKNSLRQFLPGKK